MSFSQDDKTIVQPSRNLCLDCEPKDKQLFMKACDKNSKTQKWTIQNINKEQMAKWNEDRFNFKSKKKKPSQR